MLLSNIERGGTSQRKGQSRAAQTGARITRTERGGSPPSEKKSEKILNNNHFASSVIIKWKISKVLYFPKDWMFSQSCFLFQRLEEIMRRTRRTDSPDTVRITFVFLESTLPLGLTQIQYPLTTNQLSFCKPNSLSLTKVVNTIFTEICSSEDTAKWSPTKGKHRAYAQWHYRRCRQAASGDKDLTAGAEQRRGHGSCRGLQRAQVSEDSHRPGGNPDAPTSR